MICIDKKTNELCIVEGNPTIHSAKLCIASNHEDVRLVRFPNSGNSSIFTQEDFQERFSCISKTGKIDVEKMMELLVECREIIGHYLSYDRHPDWDDLAKEVFDKLNEVLK